MKKLCIALLAISFLAACNGDHSAKSGADTVRNRYGETNDSAGTAKKSIDTSKVTSKTGDASNLDNSASGGTKASKDTSKHK